MAPISSGSSTWTSSGIPFSFVSMATGIGPSTSGSQATVASVVTSTLLAGLGFSGGVISAFPSSVWPSRAPTHQPTKDQVSTSASAVLMTSAKDNSDAGGEDIENITAQGEDEEREGEDEDEEEEREEEKDKKKGRKASFGVCEAGRMDKSKTVNEPPSEDLEANAKEKKRTKLDPSGVEDQLEYTSNPLDSNLTTVIEATNETAEFPASTDPAKILTPRTGGNKKNWPFSIHTGKSIDVHVKNQFALICYSTRKMEFCEF